MIPKIFVAVSRVDGKLVTSVISTLPVEVIVVLDTPRDSSAVGYVELSESVPLEDSFRETVFDAVASQLQNGKLNSQQLALLSKSLEFKQ